MNIVKPIKIASPISGQPCVPRLVERRYGDYIYQEAVWIDPSSGAFIRKGIVKITEASTGRDVTLEVVGR
jgi:hypothetical protein